MNQNQTLLVINKKKINSISNNRTTAVASVKGDVCILEDGIRAVQGTVGRVGCIMAHIREKVRMYNIYIRMKLILLLLFLFS